MLHAGINPFAVKGPDGALGGRLSVWPRVAQDADLLMRGCPRVLKPIAGGREGRVLRRLGCRPPELLSIHPCGEKEEHCAIRGSRGAAACQRRGPDPDSDPDPEAEAEGIFSEAPLARRRCVQPRRLLRTVSTLTGLAEVLSR